MRESIGGISLFQIVIVFILIFIAIMCFTINHSKAFSIKDEVVSIIENSNIDVSSDQGLTDDTINAIIDRMGEIGYRTTGDCNPHGDDGWVGYKASNTGSGWTEDNNNALFCVKVVDVPEQHKLDLARKCSDANDCTIVGKDDYPYMYYYKIKLFYQLDVPVIRRMNLNIVSSTKVIFTERKRNPGCKFTGGC